MKKILISDYDKTLYTSDESIKKNIEKIKEFRAKGNLFVIATGRSYPLIEKKIVKYNIEYDYLIISHGTVILDKNNKDIRKCLIDNDVAKSIRRDYSDIAEISSVKVFNIFKDDASFDDDNLTKLSMIVDGEEFANKISNEINNKYKDYVKSYVILTHKYILVEVISNITDKAKAISYLLELEEINEHNVYTIGDGSNDIEMIEKYNGYGMTNSEECVLKVVTKLYNSVSDLIDEIE